MLMPTPKSLPSAEVAILLVVGFNGFTVQDEHRVRQEII